MSNPWSTHERPVSLAIAAHETLADVPLNVPNSMKVHSWPAPLPSSPLVVGVYLSMADASTMYESRARGRCTFPPPRIISIAALASGAAIGTISLETSSIRAYLPSPMVCRACMGG